MIEPYKEAQIIATVFQWTAPAAVKWKPISKGLCFEWEFYVGRGYKTGYARAYFSDLHGLHCIGVSTGSPTFFEGDFRWLSGTPAEPEKPDFRVRQGRLLTATTKYALQYLVVKGVDTSVFVEQYSYPVTATQRVEWLLEHKESMARWAVPVG